MKKTNRYLQILLVLILLIIFLIIANKKMIFKIPTAEKGLLTVSAEDFNRGYIPLKGDFKVYDGIYNPNELNNINTEEKYMCLNELRRYDYPSGLVTAVLNIEIEDNYLPNAMIIEEIYTANRVYINEELISSAGSIGSTISDTIKEKRSNFIPLNLDSNKLEVVIHIANFDEISGQFERNIFIGDYDSLNTFHINRLVFKMLSVTFYLTLSLILISMYLINRKYTYLLTLALAGLMNFYYIVTHVEPIILFNIKNTVYHLNSILSTSPAIFSQFFSALTVLVLYKNNFVYNNLNKFIKYNVSFFLFVMTITVIFDEAANPLYILTVIYSLCLIVYSGSITLKNYIRTSKKSSLILLIGIMIYVLSYSNLIYISVMHNPYQTLGHSMIYLILIQGIFHLIMAYLIISNFAYNFLLAQTEESKLESIIEDRTNELKKSYNALLKQDNIRRQMIMDISHDLKSPVTIIKGYLELLVTNKIKDENREEYLNIAYKKTSYMSDLISELFTLFNLEIDNSFSREKENLNDLITDICSGRTNVKVDIPKDLELYCSEKHFRRLINNLIENSLTHGGNKCLINISTIRENSDLTLIFSDDGIGIHPEIMPYIFNRFKRGDKSRHENEKHFGLGLSICKAIVEKHNGTIECESIFGKGATFKINLKGAIE